MRKAARRLFRVLGTGLLAGSLAGAANAATFVDFDSIASGDPANDAVVGLGFRFDLAAYLPELDEFGDPIPGSDAYRPDPDAVDDARVDDPSTPPGPSGYGVAPSTPHALNAIDQGILITFDAITDLASFSITLDNSTLGFPGIFDIVFQNFDGDPIYALPTQQSTPGFVASLPGPLSDVASIYLPSGAYYDNLSFEVVPEPDSYVLTALGLGAFAWWRRRPSAAGSAGTGGARFASPD